MTLEQDFYTTLRSFYDLLRRLQENPSFWPEAEPHVREMGQQLSDLYQQMEAARLEQAA